MNNIGYFMQPATLRTNYPSHVQWSGDNRLFSPPECDALIAMGDTLGWQQASIGSEDSRRIDPDYRCVQVATVPFGRNTDWLYERISKRVDAANSPYYGFDLVGLLEPFQLLKYEAASTADAIPGHYGWHQDFGAGYMGRRKLSIVVNLSDPAEYDGCRLTLMTHQQEEMRYVGRGEGCVFPSWTPHYVSPITRGTRYAIVAWVHGPPFR